MPSQELVVDPGPSDGAMIARVGVQRLFLGGEGVEQGEAVMRSSTAVSGTPIAVPNDMRPP